MSFFTRAAAMLIAASFAVAFPCAPLPAAAQTAKTQTISGTVVDAATGLPLAGATVSVSAGGSSRVVATTDADGRFTLTGLPPGEYVLVAQTQSYQAAQSDTVELLSGTQPAVTLSLQRQTAGSGLAVIGRTSTRRSESLQRSSVIYRSVTSTDVIDQGQFRIVDVLKTLPGVFDANAQTASFGDDIRLSVRGIGVLETTALLDGHPLAQGVPGGFSFELSPTAGIRDTSVVYGSGSDLYPVNAIGGIINMQTLDPTRTPQSAVILNYGTFNKTGAIVQRTGSAGRLGYAFAYGSQGLDGPYKHQRLYNFSAAQDPSGGPGSPGYQSGVYDFDSSSNSHTGFAKLRWTFSPATRMTVQWTGVGFYDDKTGNGDGDYQTNALTLANASQGSCPAGQYATFTNSAINGTPAVPCLSRADYLARYGGWNGAGPAFQTLQFNDYAAKFETKLGGGEISLNAFGNRYSQHYDRSKQLPYFYTPGDNPTVRDTYVSNAGAILSDTFNTDRNSFAFGAYLSTLTYTGTSVNAALDPNGNVGVSYIIGAGQAKETSFFVRDSYQFANSPLTAFANIWSKRSTQTGTTSLDPRLALVYNRGGTAVR
ncbi:MAG: Outer rane ferrienterochelin/colicin receptor, partial [Candidatus Eremiobacteraeota bacterium]|nr:Outer rane ferrienterochelin/colicin receptor [Candidatus Eremiobacteraeota bacterium]